MAHPPAHQTTQPSVQVIWRHIGKFFDVTRVVYVVRVTNSGNSPASVALNARALDASGVIVGSSQDVLPNIPPHSHFDYFGYLGGGGAFDTKLTGKPARLDVSRAPHAFGEAGAIELPVLATSAVKLTEGSDDTYTDATYSYNLSAKVTDTAGHEIDGGVTQQVVLYDKAGHVVGGDTGSSDNVPQSLPAGMSYRESWTGIPAYHHATRAAYTVAARRMTGHRPVDSSASTSNSSITAPHPTHALLPALRPLEA